MVTATAHTVPTAPPTSSGPSPDVLRKRELAAAQATPTRSGRPTVDRAALAERDGHRLFAAEYDRIAELAEDEFTGTALEEEDEATTGDVEALANSYAWQFAHHMCDRHREDHVSAAVTTHIMDLTGPEWQSYQGNPDARRIMYDALYEKLYGGPVSPRANDRLPPLPSTFSFATAAELYPSVWERR